MIFGISPYLNILCTSSEKRYYTENTNYFKHDVRLLHTYLKINNHCWLWASIGQYQFNMSTLYPKHHRCSFSSRSDTPFIAHIPCTHVSLTGLSSVTGCASNDQRLGSLVDTIFGAKLSRVRNWPDWGPNYLGASFSGFHELHYTGKRWHLNGELSFLA